MIHFLRSEILKIKTDFVLCGAIAAIMGAAFILSHVNFADTPETLRLTDGTEMMRGEFVFRRSIADATFTLWLSVVFAAIFISADFASKTIHQVVMCGKSRKIIFAAKTIEYYIFALFSSFLYPLVSIIRFGLPWLSTLSGGDFVYVIRCIGMRLLLDAAAMSFSLAVAFIFMDIFRTIIANFILVMMFTELERLIPLLMEGSLMKKIVTLYPTFQLPLIMMQDVSLTQLLFSVGSALSFVLLAVIVSYLFFRKAEFV